MATTYTPNYNLAQPEVGGEPDTWGGLLNADLGTLDSVIKAVSDVANGAVPKVGGTMTGNLIMQPGSGAIQIALRAVSGNARSVFGTTNATARWEIQLDDNSAETTGNTGSNFNLHRYSDAGAYIDTPISVNRATGLVALGTLQAGTSTIGSLSSTANGATNRLRTIHDGAGNTAFQSVNPSGAAFAALGITGSTVTITAGSGIFMSNPVGVAGDLTVTGSTRVQGAGGTAWIDDRAGGNSWGQYVTSNTLRIFGNGADRMTVNSSGVVAAADFQATSDARLKTDVEPLTNALERLKAMPPRSYVKEGRPEVGFIAQEVQAQLYTAVAQREDGMLLASPGQIGALVAAAVLELEARVAALELV